MPIAPDFTSVYQQDWDIHFTLCTPDSRLKYTELCNLLQLTAGYHAEKGGIAFHDMQAFDQAWVMSRMRLEIKELPKWGDRVTVKTWIISLESSRSVRAMEVYRGDEKLAACETFWAVFNTKTRRPEALKLPHAHFEKFNSRFSTTQRVKKIDLPTEGAGEIAGGHVAKLSDLDLVDHVNNVKYLEWCLDTLPPGAVLDSHIATLDMNFMSELLLGDSVEILKVAAESSATFALKKGSKSVFGLEIYFQ